MLLDRLASSGGGTGFAPGNAPDDLRDVISGVAVVLGSPNGDWVDDRRDRSLGVLPVTRIEASDERRDVCESGSTSPAHGEGVDDT